jgi:hypothetical protein
MLLPLQLTSFTPLTTYLRQLEESRLAAAAAALSIPTGSSNGEKRKGKELEPEKKKVKVSHGVKALEKVSTRGMKDMRSFFKKPTKTEPVKS